MDNEHHPINQTLMLIVMVSAAVLILIFIGVLSGQTFNLSQPMINAVGNTSYPNDNVTGIPILNNTAYYFDYANIQPGTLTLLNGTSGAVYGLGNFTIDYVGGSVTPILLNISNAQLNASYYYWSGTARTSIVTSVQSSFQALSQTGTYLPIIVLAIVIVLILGIVMGFMSIGNGGSSGRNAL